MNSNNVSANRAKLREEAGAWWVRMDSGSADAEEHAAFQRWLAADPLHKMAYDEVNGLWHELDAIKDRLADTVNTVDLSSVKSSPKGEGWVRGNQHRIKSLFISPHPNLLPEGEGVFVLKTTAFPRWQWGLAAFGMCCVLLLLGPLAVFLRADFYTGTGETRSVQLADGSTVHLNSNTAVSCVFDPSARRLTLLQGEAFFQVSPDRIRPFQVRAGNGTVTALGTAFNVRIQDGGAEVTVTEHSVAVNVDQIHAPNEKIIVAGGQQLIYSVESGVSDTTIVDTYAATAWQRSKLVFQDKPLGDVIAELNKYHRGYFMISDAHIAARRVNGVFPTGKPVEVLNALEKSLQLHSTRLSDYWVLLHQ